MMLIELKEKKPMLVGLIMMILTFILKNGNFNQMLLTLKHELMHVWLYENGHTNQKGDEIFSYEDVCEYVALSNNSINKIVNLYLQSKEKML